MRRDATINMNAALIVLKLHWRQKAHKILAVSELRTPEIRHKRWGFFNYLRI